MQLSIIIVSYQVKYFLEQCICSVYAAVKNIAAEIIVVDNNSQDDTVEFLAEKFPAVNIIENKTNNGFAKACNQGLQLAKGDHILFLNPDTIVGEDCIINSLAFLKAHEDAGAIGLQMADGTGNFLPESKRSFPSAWVSLSKLSGLSSLFPGSKFFNSYALGYIDNEKVCECDILCGAYMMASTEILKQLHGFDESFFMYGEDIDLSYRIQKTGRKNYYLGNSSIIHFKGESSGQNRKKHVQVFYDAMQIFVRKHYAGSHAMLMRFFLHLGIFSRKLVTSINDKVKPGHLHKNLSGFYAQKHFILCGDNISANEALVMLRKNIPDVKHSFCGLKEKPVISNSNNMVLIFCTGILTYADCINMMKQHKKNTEYLWHGLNTGSITGSHHKDFTGIVFSAG